MQFKPTISDPGYSGPLLRPRLMPTQGQAAPGMRLADMLRRPGYAHMNQHAQGNLARLFINNS
jgi:hypothetical protein